MTEMTVGNNQLAKDKKTVTATSSVREHYEKNVKNDEEDN